jgi:hypothetical protein
LLHTYSSSSENRDEIEVLEGIEQTWQNKKKKLAQVIGVKLDEID